MAATLSKLQTRTQRLDQERAQKLRQHILAFDAFDLPEEAVRSVLLTIDRQTATTRGWTFVMLSPTQNAAVVGWLRHHSARSGMAVQLWAELLTGLRIDTGEVLLSREELAARVDAAPTSVSQVLTELEQIGAISRHRQRTDGMRGPGRLAIFINPNVATRLSGAIRDKAQETAQPVSVPVLPKTTSRRASGQKLPKVVAK